MDCWRWRELFPWPSCAWPVHESFGQSVMKRVLVTGGAGYIGSHTLVELSQRGYELFVLDDFSNSSPRSLEAVAKVIGKKIPHVVCDIRSVDGVSAALRDFQPDAVIHFAGVKSVGESCRDLLLFFVF